MITLFEDHTSENQNKHKFFENITSFCEKILIDDDRGFNETHYSLKILSKDDLHLFTFKIFNNNIVLYHSRNDTYKKLGNYLYYKISNFTQPLDSSRFKNVRFTKEFIDMEFDIEEYEMFDDTERFGL